MPYKSLVLIARNEVSLFTWTCAWEALLFLSFKKIGKFLQELLLSVLIPINTDFQLRESLSFSIPVMNIEDINIL